MTLGENIRSLREHAGISQKEFGELFGKSDSTVSMWESDSTEPKIGIIEKMAEIFSLKKSDILEDKLPANAIRARSSGHKVTAPLYGTIGAGWERGAWEIVDDISIPEDVLERYPDGYFLRVSGQSMNKVLPDGSFAFFKPAQTADTGDIVAVIINGDEVASVKEFHETAESIIFAPKSFDRGCTDLTIKKYDSDLDVRIIGKLVWAMVDIEF